MLNQFSKLCQHKADENKMRFATLKPITKKKKGGRRESNSRPGISALIGATVPYSTIKLLPPYKTKRSPMLFIKITF